MLEKLIWCLALHQHIIWQIKLYDILKVELELLFHLLGLVEVALTTFL